MDLERAQLIMRRLQDACSEEEFSQLLREAEECLRYDFKCQTCGCISCKALKMELRPKEIRIFLDLFYVAKCTQCGAVNFSMDDENWFEDSFTKYSSILTKFFED